MADTRENNAKARQEQAKSRMEADKKKLGEDNATRQKAMAEREKQRGTPTPTQEEADLIKLGHHPELAKDGSPEDPNVGFGTRPKTYEDRQMRASSTSSPPAPRSGHSGSHGS
jgi:regulator of protease activity HflC (stomatin/prohibitin superfamily)